MEEFYHLMVRAFSVKDYVLKRDKAVLFVHLANLCIGCLTVKENEAAAYLFIYPKDFFCGYRDNVGKVNRVFTGRKRVVFTNLANKVSNRFAFVIEKTRKLFSL